MRTRIKFGQASVSDRIPVTGKKYIKRVENKYSLGGPTPFFPNYTEIWFWEWKNGKRNMKAEGDKVSILKTLVHSHFSNNTTKFRFGDGKNVKNGEKVYETNL